MTREESSTGTSTTALIFVLCLVFVYLLLSAQYESYILPLAVLFSIPFGLAGSFIFAQFMHVDNNIYLQIALIMLIGLLAKNAILIVEFALDRRRQGMTYPLVGDRRFGCASAPDPDDFARTGDRPAADDVRVGCRRQRQQYDRYGCHWRYVDRYVDCRSSSCRCSS